MIPLQSTQRLQQKSFYLFQIKSSYLNSEGEITFNGQFDSSNLMKVHQLTSLHYAVQSGPDCEITGKPLPKCWFYFKVSSTIHNIPIKITIKEVHLLWALAKHPQLYQPIIKYNDEKWERFQNQVEINIPNTNELDLSFEICFKQGLHTISIAFSYPFSYSECQEYLSSLADNFSEDEEIYFHKEIFVKSYEERNIDLITISSYDGILKEQEQIFTGPLFPENRRPHKFRSNKPIVFLSARVHPGETPSSYVMNGVLKFLLNKQDERAAILRSLFVFILIPMLNPDGVYRGNYRMDSCNQNLNRFYHSPSAEKQSVCYAITQYAQHLNSEQRLYFYCDFHAHAARKGCFAYGNAIDDFVSQVESMVFAKTLALNSPNFEYDFCNFSKKQMSSKDRYEDLTKEGCGRVWFYRNLQIINAYTLECGFHSNQNPPLAFYNSTTPFDLSSVDEQSETRQAQQFYNIEHYENLGKNLLITILDVLEKNPYSCLAKTVYKNLENIRKEVANQVAKLDRFKKEDSKLMLKAKKIQELTQELIYQKLSKKGVFDVLELRRQIKTGTQLGSISKRGSITKPPYISLHQTQSQSQKKIHKLDFYRYNSSVQLKFKRKEEIKDAIQSETPIFPSQQPISPDRQMTKSAALKQQFAALNQIQYCNVYLQESFDNMIKFPYVKQHYRLVPLDQQQKVLKTRQQDKKKRLEELEKKRIDEDDEVQSLTEILKIQKNYQLKHKEKNLNQKNLKKVGSSQIVKSNNMSNNESKINKELRHYINTQYLQEQ